MAFRLSNFLIGSVALLAALLGLASSQDLRALAGFIPHVDVSGLDGATAAECEKELNTCLQDLEEAGSQLQTRDISGLCSSLGTYMTCVEQVQNCSTTDLRRQLHAEYSQMFFQREISCDLGRYAPGAGVSQFQAPAVFSLIVLALLMVVMTRFSKI